MGLTNISLALRQFLLRSTSLRHSTLIGIPLFFTTLFRLASLNKIFSLSDKYPCVSTKVALFEYAEVFRKDLLLVLYFSLFSLMISLFLCLFSSAALFMLVTWPFCPPPLGSCCGGSNTKSSDLTGVLV